MSGTVTEQVEELTHLLDEANGPHDGQFTVMAITAIAHGWRKVGHGDVVIRATDLSRLLRCYETEVVVSSEVYDRIRAALDTTPTADRVRGESA